MKTISLKIPQLLHERLKEEAERRQVTLSDVVRESLATRFEGSNGKKGASCFDLAEDLAASVTGLPKDIAVNPKYMDGFGL